MSSSEPHFSKGDKSQIDSDPQLSGEEQAEAFPAKRLSKKPLILVLLVGLILVVIFFVIGNQGEPKSVTRALAEIHPKSTDAFLAPPPMMKAVKAFDEFCGRDAVLCSTVTTNKPSETFANLRAALPQGEGKLYRVKVSVEPVEE